MQLGNNSLRDLLRSWQGWKDTAFEAPHSMLGLLTGPFLAEPNPEQHPRQGMLEACFK